jgi:hypothetical protein
MNFFLIRDPDIKGWFYFSSLLCRIRDEKFVQKCLDPDLGSGMKENVRIPIRDKTSGSATLACSSKSQIMQLIDISNRKKQRLSSGSLVGTGTVGY